MIQDETEIERRKPVWAALSELWLDTELTHDDLQRIAGVMKTLGYSLSQLREIYLFEVAPIVFGNLLTVAGTWSGFDEEWLFNQVAKRARKRSLSLRMFVKTGIGKWFMTCATERHWDGMAWLYSEVHLSSPRGFELEVLLDGDEEMRVCAEGLSVYDTLKRKWIIGKELEYRI
jgi:hypothetical protein